jgi:hypothetical protein
VVIAPEPAVERGGAFVGVAVEGAVGPFVEHCADEAFDSPMSRADSLRGWCWPSCGGRR